MIVQRLFRLSFWWLNSESETFLFLSAQQFPGPHLYFWGGGGVFLYFSYQAFLKITWRGTVHRGGQRVWGAKRTPNNARGTIHSQLTATPPSTSTPQATPRCLCLVPSFSLFHFPTSSVFSQNRDTPDQHQQYTQHTTHTHTHQPDQTATGLDWTGTRLPAPHAPDSHSTRLGQSPHHFSYEA
ncbi:hypothetical protein DL95DRAFT_129615 [Leptodontidium sp. 2 PMI_412]|nr:hypothetical protein DL95DRAFT_129615 [Leptodontidium sp. 2 PMI_412]